MNVFVLDRDHDQRARYHCDVHLNKMLLESVQILNTALHKQDHDRLEDIAFYKPTHANHPWCEWAADRFENWHWLLQHAKALGVEYTMRNDSTHESYRKLYELWVDGDAELDTEGTPKYLWKIEDVFSDGPRTSVPLCMPDEYADSDDPITSYRRYYVAEKVPQDWCTWSNEIPSWVLDMQ